MKRGIARGVGAVGVLHLRGAIGRRQKGHIDRRLPELRDDRAVDQVAPHLWSPLPNKTQAICDPCLVERAQLRSDPYLPVRSFSVSVDGHPYLEGRHSLGSGVAPSLAVLA